MNTLPRSLIRFEAGLADAIRREHSPRRLVLGGRPMLRLSLAAAAAAAVALGVLSALPGSGPNVVARAAAALRVTGATILHVDVAGLDVHADGSSSSWTEEAWQQASAPYARRAVRTENGLTADIVTDAPDNSQLYDATTNTIYSVNAPGLSQVKQGRPAPAPPLKQPPAGEQPSRQEVPKGQAASPSDDPIRAKVLAMLDNGAVSAAGRTTVEGRDALKLASADGSLTIFVDPQTYDPIEWNLSGGDGTGTTVHFTTYERLPETSATASLFDLQAQHPTARVDTDPADYAAALSRLTVGS
jgi:hypothetical protein